MDALGNLAGGIAHDFNNILGTILGNAELALEDIGGEGSTRESLVQIQAAAKRARDLTQQILLFGRRQATQRTVIPLAPLVEECVRLLRVALSPLVSLESSVEADAPQVKADRSQLLQVLLNITANAVHAPQGKRSRIEIRLERLELSDEAPRTTAELQPGTYALITIEDTGAGMAADTLERIFEPFFTTKPAGEGTGLGLSVVHGIVRAHGGDIAAHSTLGEGSRFEVFLPAAAIEADTRDMGSSSQTSAAGTGQHIMCVDDDDSMVFLLRRMLERRGYKVSGFIDAGQALDALHRDPELYDALVTDFNMPGISGLEVVRAAHKIRADLPIAMSSGYITEALREEGLAAGARVLIDKPTDIDDYCAAIERLLGAGLETGE